MDPQQFVERGLAAQRAVDDVCQRSRTERATVNIKAADGITMACEVGRQCFNLGHTAGVVIESIEVDEKEMQEFPRDRRTWFECTITFRRPAR